MKILKHFLPAAFAFAVCAIGAAAYTPHSVITKTVEVEAKTAETVEELMDTELTEIVEEETMSEEEAEALDKTSDNVKTVKAEGLTDGSYTGTGYGWANSAIAYKAGMGVSSPSVSATITVSGGKITAITATSSDTSEYFSKAKAMIPYMISAQSTGVDIVSGATYSSNGLKQAVNNAISKAGGSSSKAEEEKSEESKDTASGSENTEESPADTGDDDGSKAEENAEVQYADGTYRGEGEGLWGAVVVDVTVSDGRISAIDLVSTEDDELWFNDAWTITEDIIEKQTYKVDIVSGATYSSAGIMDAVKDALSKAPVCEEEDDESSDDIKQEELYVSEESTGDEYE